MISIVFALLSTTAAAEGMEAFVSALVVDKQTVLLFEFFIAFLVVIYVLCFLYGSHQNLNLARAVAHNLRNILEYQFVRFGTEDGKTLLKDGQSFYWFHATGRRNTSGLTVFLDLAKRMDIFSYTSGLMTSPERDRIVFYLPITNDVAMDPLTLFIVKRKELDRLRNVEEGLALQSVERFAGQVVDVNGFPSELITMTEHSDISTALLPERIRNVIARQARNLISIHVTENGAKWDAQCSVSNRLVRVEFVLPKQRSNLPDVLEDMCQIAIHFVDAVADTRMSATARKKVLELRRRAQIEEEKKAQKARAEEAAARRLAKQKEKEEAVSKMSGDKQVKYEAKKRKKELNARMKKSVKKVL